MIIHFKSNLRDFFASGHYDLLCNIILIVRILLNTIAMRWFFQPEISFYVIFRKVLNYFY